MYTQMQINAHKYMYMHVFICIVYNIKLIQKGFKAFLLSQQSPGNRNNLNVHQQKSR